MARTAEENRAEAEAMIRDGRMKGYLARMDAGWSVGATLTTSVYIRNIPRSVRTTGRALCAVTCFVIDSEYRRQGIARALLRRAFADYAALGYEYIESYPVTEDGSCASHYHGHPAMYESEGFKVYLRLEGRLCMRRSLKGVHQ